MNAASDMNGAAILVVASLLFTAACASNPPVAAGARDRGILEDFQQRVNRYMALRDAAADPLLPLEPTPEAGSIKAAQDELAARILARRGDAKHGEIFTPDIRSYFRELLAPELKGEQGRDVRARLNDDAPEPGAVPLEVNAVYPAGTPFPTTPAPVLAALPMLPRGLEYRIIGRDLILLDQPANIIVDYMRNAIPPRPQPASRP